MVQINLVRIDIDIKSLVQINCVRIDIDSKTLVQINLVWIDIDSKALVQINRVRTDIDSEDTGLKGFFGVRNLIHSYIHLAQNFIYYIYAFSL